MHRLLPWTLALFVGSGEGISCHCRIFSVFLSQLSGNTDPSIKTYPVARIGVTCLASNSPDF